MCVCACLCEIGGGVSVGSLCASEKGPLVLSDRGIRSNGHVYLSLCNSVSGLIIRSSHRLRCQRRATEDGGGRKKEGGLNPSMAF